MNRLNIILDTFTDKCFQAIDLTGTENQAEPREHTTKQKKITNHKTRKLALVKKKRKKAYTQVFV